MGNKDDSEMKTGLAAKKEPLDDDSGPLESVALAMIGDNRVLTDLVDRVQAETRDHIFRLELDIAFLRNEKILEKKLRPWLDYKVDLLMGGAQSDLVEYILRKVNSNIQAEALISDLN